MVSKPRSTQEKWLTDLGMEFVEVRIYTRDGWVAENHVDDRSCIQGTINMSMDRIGGHCAVLLCPQGHFELYDRRRNEMTCFPTQEAAEMVAMHRGH